jgi:hypothetical protein
MQSKTIPKIVLVCSLALIYFAGMARGLTWANQGADGGDLITAAATGGIAHPSGYPTYLLIARLFQFIPIGSLAFRTNIMSAFMAVCATLAVYEIVSASQNRLASLASAYAIGLSPLFWSQAVITEVYALHVLCIAILLLLSAKNSHHFLFGLIFGLGMGNHITIIFTLPVLFNTEKKYLLQRIMGVGLGLTVYLTLPLRAMTHPPVNWGNPVTLENFIWLVSGKLYQGQLFSLTPGALWGRIQASAALFLEQFGVIGLLIGFMGVIVYYKPSRLNYNMFWITSAFLIFPLAYDTRDSFVYLLPAFLCFAIWIGIGLGNLMDIAAQSSRRVSLWIGSIFLAILFLQAIGHWRQVDAAHDDRAENFGKEIMATIPGNAIIFAKGDQAVLSLWYFHYALKERPDIAIIATDLLQNEWYQETIRNNYPNLTLPDFFMFPEVVSAYNPGRTICHVEYARSAQITCEGK